MSTDIVKILIVDDTPANVKIITKFLERKSYQVISAMDGQEAIDKFKSESPDIVLMDVMMPNIDGYEATKEIRALEQSHWVPIIFLSAKTTVDDQIKAIELGGDDYLTKPVDLRMLEVKLFSMLRIVNMQRELTSAHRKLQKYFDRSASEMELAKKLMVNMTQKYSALDTDQIKIFNSPAEDISGDIAICYKAINDKFYFLLADATGHGLSAAISQIPLSQIFYEMAEKNFSVSAIAKQMNLVLKSLLPPDRFAAATLVSLDKKNKIIEVWNGSNPSPIFINSKNEIARKFSESNFALGIVEDKHFSTRTDMFLWEESGEFLVFSDGLLDLENSHKEVFGNAGIKRAIDERIDTTLTIGEAVIEQASKFCGEVTAKDDLSLISILCE